MIITQGLDFLHFFQENASELLILVNSFKWFFGFRSTCPSISNVIDVTLNNESDKTCVNKAGNSIKH